MTRPADNILNIVCGLAEPLRSRRWLLMLKVYVDDSGIGQSPGYFLGGWLAPVSTWLAFSKDWDAALRMSPRIQYFSLNEAMNGSGEFYGLSETSRDEKLRVLAHTIADHRLTLVSSIIPHKLFQSLFAADDPLMVDRLFKNPYYFLFFGLISQIYKFQKKCGVLEKIEFIFDEQVDQEGIVLPMWTKFRQSSPRELRDMISGTINFLNDRDTLPLQAADFCAGGYYRNVKEAIHGQGKQSIWHGIVDDLPFIEWIMTPEIAVKILEATIPVPNHFMNPTLDGVWHALLKE